VRFTDFPGRRSFELFVEHVIPALAD
jgi:hypothetical protein